MSSPAQSTSVTTTPQSSPQMNAAQMLIHLLSWRLRLALQAFNAFHQGDVIAMESTWRTFFLAERVAAWTKFFVAELVRAHISRLLNL
jgi:hypothetical protein